MIKTSLPKWGVVLFIALFTVSIYAQEKAPKDELYLMHEDIIKIGMVDKYEANVKKELALWKKHGMQTEIKFASKTDNGHYFYLTRLKDFSSIDKENEKWKHFSEKAGEETLAALYKDYDNTYVSHRNVIMRRSVELSYQPENSRITRKDADFIHFDHYYIKEGKVEQAIQMMKEFKILMEGKKSSDPYNVWFGDLGTEIGWLVVTRYAKDNVDYYQEANRRMDTFAKEFKERWPKFRKLLKRFSHNNGTIMKEFQYSNKD